MSTSARALLIRQATALHCGTQSIFYRDKIALQRRMPRNIKMKLQSFDVEENLLKNTAVLRRLALPANLLPATLFQSTPQGAF